MVFAALIKDSGTQDKPGSIWSNRADVFFFRMKRIKTGVLRTSLQTPYFVKVNFKLHRWVAIFPANAENIRKFFAQMTLFRDPQNDDTPAN